jgi:ATP phosphoribosyltransferase
LVKLAIDQPLVIAVPKGRILKELRPVMEHIGLIPEDAFFDEDDRRLRFGSNHALIELIRVRSFDVASFVAFGAAHVGICGSDVLAEFDYPDIYAPVDLGIGKCRVSLAGRKDAAGMDYDRLSHIRVATKYPNITRSHFAEMGIQAECIKLNGAIELAPILGLSTHIVDLVSTGGTLKANGLMEEKVLAQVSSRLIVNRTAFKTRAKEMHALVTHVREAVEKGLGHA